jgi:hypothetical protein
MSRFYRRTKAEIARDAEIAEHKARMKAQYEAFEMLPAGPAKMRLVALMTDRITKLYNDTQFEAGDELLWFLPDAYAKQLLEWYFDEDGTVPQPTHAPTGEDENSQPGEVQGEPQEPGGPDGEHSREADAGTIVDLVRDLVALWTNQKIQGLPRSERNAAIEETRAKLIAAIKGDDA